MLDKPKGERIIDLTDENILPTYGRFPVAIERGEGATLYDFDGGKYIDFTSGIGVCSLGYGNSAWLDAVTAQAKKLPHISNLFYTEPAAKLAKELTERTGMSGAFFSNSGAESNEAAIKLARKYSFDKYGSGRSTVITLHHSFHGRTVTTLSATGQDVFHNWFFPFTEGFRYVEPGDTDALRTELKRGDVCAVLLELIQGEGGVLPLSPEYVSEAAKLCREHDALLMTDEVQTGVGRTGSLFCFQRFGLLPDVCSFAKGIAGGLPMGGILVNERCRNVLSPGSHATTFGGNPICAAGALAVLATLSTAMLDEIAEKGDYIRAQILDMHLPAVTGVRGMGLMVGVGVNVPHKALCARLIENGLLSLTAGADTIRFLPPLTISREEIDEGLDIFKRTLAAI